MTAGRERDFLLGKKLAGGMSMNSVKGNVLAILGRNLLAAAAVSVPIALLSLDMAHSQTSDVVIYQPKNDVERAAQEMLAKNCSRCHQEGRLEYQGKPYRQKPESGFGDILQLDRLAENTDRITKGNPQGSKLFAKIVNSEMPKDFYEGDFEKPSPSKEEVRALEKWINLLGETLVASCEPAESSSYERLAQQIAQDLLNQPESRRKGTRYLSFANLLDACALEEEMKVYRQGAIKLLNSLGSNSDVLAIHPIDERGTAIRFHLDDLGWSADLWEQIVTGYPYGIRPANGLYESLVQASGSDIPFVRADWLAFYAARPPLYNKILALPNSFAELQAKLGIDVAENISAHRVWRAGFQKSEISANNRLVERHTIDTGAFWTSYDFAGNKKRQSLFQFPLGPGGKSGFVHDGGETIFNLPNGFQAYYLNKANGEFIPEGPPDIVLDRVRKEAVTNGISCMSCHSEGIKNVTDEIGPHVEANKSVFSLQVRQEIALMHPDKAKMDQLIQQDRGRFQSALRNAGLDPELTLGGTEMINALSDRYERKVDLRAAAAEYGVPLENFPRSLVAAGGQSLETQLQLASVPRDHFETEFGQFVERIIDGTFIAPSTGAAAKLKPGSETQVVAAKPADLQVSLLAEKANYQAGEKLVLTVKTDRDCFLTLVNIDGSGNGGVIFPNAFSRDNHIRGAQDFIFPPTKAASGEDEYDFKLNDVGDEQVVAICDESGEALVNIQHDFAQDEFTNLGAGEAVGKAINIVKRQRDKGVGRTAIRLHVHQ